MEEQQRLVTVAQLIAQRILLVGHLRMLSELRAALCTRGRDITTFLVGNRLLHPHKGRLAVWLQAENSKK